MPMIDLDGTAIHWREDGAAEGPALVFANALGTDLRIWDAVIARLPAHYRMIRYDMRGHGLSDLPAATCTMGQLVHDAERLLERLEVRDCVFVGLSVGGMVAQGLAAKRPDLLRGLVLSHTAARIGTREIWAARIGEVRAGGIEAIADGIMEKWFTRAFRATPELRLWRNMVTRQPVDGYTAICQAIAGTDFYTTTAALNLPVLAIAGAEDGSTPPDLVRETAGLVAGARFELLRGAGHLACVETPEAYAACLTGFLTSIGV